MNNGRASRSCLLVLLTALASACGGGGGGGGAANNQLGYSPATGGYPVGFPIELAPANGGAATAFAIDSGSLPAGVTFDTATGTFGGRPLVAESVDLVVSASDGATAKQQALTLHVVPPPATRFVYVAESADDLLSAFLVQGENGVARHVGVVATGDEPRIVGVAPGSTHVAVGTKFEGLWLYSIHPVHGRPKKVPSAPLQLGSEVRDLVFHPAGTHLYVLATSGGSDDLVFQLEFDAQTGALTPLAPPALSVPDGSTALAIDPLGRALYLAHGAAVRSFEIGLDGALTAAGDRPGGGTPVDVAASPDGSAVYALNFVSKDVFRFPVAANGVLEAGALSKSLVSTIPVTLSVAGDCEYLYVGDGVGGVEMFELLETGELKVMNPAHVALNGDLRGLAADPSGAGAWATLGSRNELVALPAGAQGSLEPDLETPVRTHGMPMGIAAAPGKAPAVERATSLYAVNWQDDDFDQFAVEPDGRLSAHAPQMVSTGVRPLNVAAHPFRDALYVSNSEDALQSVEFFQLDGVGKASKLGVFEAVAGSRSLLVGLNGDLAHVVLPAALAPVSIAADGSLESLGANIAAVSTGRAARHPGGRWLYLPNGVAGGVVSYAVELQDGTLANTGGAAADPGANALAVDPTGRFLYVVGDSNAVDRVRGYALDAATGTPSQLATSPFDLPGLAFESTAVAAHPAGRVLYVATRDDQAFPGQGAIHAYAIETDPGAGAGLGALTPHGPSAILAGQQPYDMAVSPDGKALYVSIEALAGSVLVFGLNAAGKLSATPIDSEPTGALTRGLGLRTRVE